MQPGDVVGPGNTQPPKEPELPVKTSTEPIETPAAAVDSGAQQTVAESSQPESSWQFTGNTEANIQASASTPHETVSWTASEYIAHEKNGGWYILMGLAVLGFAGFVYLITQEVLSAVVILIMGVAFAVFATRKPQELTYVLDNHGLKIGEKKFSYAQFKSFTVIDEGAISSIMLMPLQRFMPPLSVYFDPSDEDKITDALSGYLPYEDRKQDPVDRLMRKVRF